MIFLETPRLSNQRTGLHLCPGLLDILDLLGSSRHVECRMMPMALISVSNAGTNYSGCSAALVGLAGGCLTDASAAGCRPSRLQVLISTHSCSGTIPPSNNRQSRVLWEGNNGRYYVVLVPPISQTHSLCRFLFLLLLNSAAAPQTTHPVFLSLHLPPCPYHRTPHIVGSLVGLVLQSGSS